MKENPDEESLKQNNSITNVKRLNEIVNELINVLRIIKYIKPKKS